MPLYFLTKLASEHVTVVLSGEGADELFGGYESYMRTPHLKLYDRVVPHGVRRGLCKIARHLPDNRLTNLMVRGGQTPEEYFIGQAKVFPEEEARAVLKTPFRNGTTVRELTAPIYQSVHDKDDVTKMMTIDMRLWLPGDILLKADKMSSAHSLELRVPFLDRDVMKVAEKIPTKYRIKDGLSKYALRKAALAEPVVRKTASRCRSATGCDRKNITMSSKKSFNRQKPASSSTRSACSAISTTTTRAKPCASAISTQRCRSSSGIANISSSAEQRCK